MNEIGRKSINGSIPYPKKAYCAGADGNVCLGIESILLARAPSLTGASNNSANIVGSRHYAEHDSVRLGRILILKGMVSMHLRDLTPHTWIAVGLVAWCCPPQKKKSRFV
jgi:hypothetical protein